MNEMSPRTQPGSLAPFSTKSSARDSASQDFSGVVFGWDRLPPESRLDDTTSQDSVYASSVVKMANYARKTQDGLVQEAIGWQAASSGVKVSVSTRRLETLGDGRRRPAGPWRTERVHTYEAIEAPSVTKVIEPVDLHPDSDPEATSELMTANKRHVQAVWTLGFLPHKYLHQVRRRVPNPDYWLGEIIQHYNWLGVASSHSLFNLCTSPSVAVVLAATRGPRNTDPWPADRDEAARRLAQAEWNLLRIRYRFREADEEIGR